MIHRRGSASILVESGRSIFGGARPFRRIGFWKKMAGSAYSPTMPARMTKQPAPSSCPNCGKPDPKLVSSFPGSLNVPTAAKSTVNVYKCQCGYLFAVENVATQPPTSLPPSSL